MKNTAGQFSEPAKPIGKVAELFAGVGATVNRSTVEFHLVGLNRSLSRTAPSIVREIVKPLQRLQRIEASFHLWLIEREGLIRNKWSEEVGTLEVGVPRSMALFQVSRIRDSTLRSRVRRLARDFTKIEDTWRDDGVTIENALAYLEGLKIAADSVSPDCDVVVLARPDVMVNGRLRLRRIVKRACRNINRGMPTTYLPAWGTHGGLNDRFAVMPRQHAVVIMNRLDLALGLVSSGARFHSEEFMRLACSGLRIESSIHTTMSRVRIGGKVPEADRKIQKEHRLLSRFWREFRKKTSFQSR